jgi:flavin reductase (DIM6/NTAB) family NADH-FMN oxidoreductase RutF
LARRFAENSPFVDSIEDVRRSLLVEYAEYKRPLLLIAGIWDESKANAAVDAGGLEQMLSAMDRAWLNAPWRDNFTKLVGYFKRPLRHTDRDVRLINEALKDLPIVLVHGNLADGHAYPTLSTWNVLPGERVGQIIHINGIGQAPKEDGQFTTPDFRNQVGEAISQIAGLLGEAYHYHNSGRTPRLELFEGRIPFEDQRVRQWLDRIQIVSRLLVSPEKSFSDASQPTTSKDTTKVAQETTRDLELLSMTQIAKIKRGAERFFNSIEKRESTTKLSEPPKVLDQDAKKTALRMIPYGIYVLTADDGHGNVAATTVNWVTQTAFAPPLVVVGVRTELGAYSVVKDTKRFTLNMLGKDAKCVAFTFIKPTTKLEDGRLSGQSIRRGANGLPILDAALAAVECNVTGIVEQGDHHIIVGEVVEAHVAKPVIGRPDAAILEMKDLGDNVFYGG